MSRRKLLVVDHPFHEQTRSSDFFVKLLEPRFDVTVDYLSVHPGDIDACVRLVRSRGPDLLVLWQVAFRARALIELGLPVTWVPMYDQSRRRWHQNYLEAAQAGVSVLAFCREVGRFARYWGLPCMDAHYYPAPTPPPDFQANANRVLIWYRGFIQPRELWPLLTGVPELRVVIKHDVDPSAPESSRDDGLLAPFIEKVVEGFVPSDEYAALLESCGLFVAPRRKEGIGLSFLDAMARGALVLAYDAPTMNEYLRHGESGWLFNERPRLAISADTIPGMRRAGYEQMKAGRAVWEAEQEEILDFIEASPIPERRRGLKSMAARPIASAISALASMKRRFQGS